MEGLEISEVKYQTVKQETEYLRFDSEFQLAIYKETLGKIQQKKFQYFGELIELLTDGKHGGITETEEGVVFLRTTNVKPNKIDLSDLRFISDLESAKTKRAELEAGDLLLTTIGTVGDCAIVPKELGKATINQNLVRIVLKNESLSSFLCAFLNSKYGKRQSLRWATGNVYQMINYPNLRLLCVPNFSNAFTTGMHTIYTSAFDIDRKSKTTFTQAESLLLKTLGMSNFAPSNESVNIKSFKDSFASSGRMDAEYYQPKYEALLKLLQRDGLTIGDMASVRNERFKPDSSGNFEYIEIGGLNGDGTVSAETTPHIAAPSRASQLVRSGDIVTSTVRPIRRLTGLIAPGQEASVCSSGFVVLNPQHIAAEVLLVFLRIPLICELLDLQTSATMYPAISEKDLLAIPIHKIKPSIQTQIAELVQQSFKLKIESERLLEVAKSAVEVAIEQDEAAGMAYLRSNS